MTKSSKQLIVEEVEQKYGEWLDEAGDKASIILVGILAQMVHNEREEKKHYKKLWNSTNGKNPSTQHAGR